MSADQNAAPVMLSLSALHRLRNHLQAICGYSYLLETHADQVKVHVAAIQAELDAATPPPTA